jgi:hypothetical protein
MNCKEIFDNILSREGLYKNIQDPFASTDLIAQENIRILNELVRELTIDNSLSDLLDDVSFKTYKKWKAGTVNGGDIVYSGVCRYLCEVGGNSVIDPATLDLEHKASFYADDGVQWKCLGDWNQYPLEYIADDIASIDTGTVMNMTNRCPLVAINAHQWAVMEANGTSSSNGYYCVKDNSIYLFKGIEDDTVIKFAYYTSKPVISGDKKQETFTSRNDTCKIPALILIYGTVFRYLSDKDIGNYEKFGTKYEYLLGKYIARGQAPQQISLSGGTVGRISNYTDGDWNV